jgi:hypothetical protein
MMCFNDRSTSTSALSDRSTFTSTGALSDHSTFTSTSALSDRSTFTSIDERAMDLRQCFFGGLVVV